MFSNWKIGKRLGLSFALSIVLVAVVAMAGFWGLSQTVQTTYSILHRDGRLMNLALQAQVDGLNLRRFEKDMFLNIGDKKKETDYSQKWNTSHAELVDELNAVDKLVTGQDDKELLKNLRADLSTYTIGFQSVLQKVADKKIKNAPQANTAMTPFKDDIHRMDQALDGFANKNVQRMNAKEKVVTDAETRTRATMWAIFGGGIVTAFLMSFRVKYALIVGIALVSILSWP